MVLTIWLYKMGVYKIYFHECHYPTSIKYTELFHILPPKTSYFRRRFFHASSTIFLLCHCTIRLGRKCFGHQPTTQYFVQIRSVLQQGLLGLQQRLLRAVAGTLGIEEVERAGYAVLETHIHQTIALGGGFVAALLGLVLLQQSSARDQRIGNIAECGLYRLLILSHRNVFTYFGQIEVGFIRTPAENR